MWSNKIRTLLAVLSIAAGVFAIGLVFGLVDQLLSGLDQAHQAIMPAHIAMALNQRIDQATASRLKSIKGVEDIEAMASLVPARSATRISVRESLSYQ